MLVIAGAIALGGGDFTVAVDSEYEVVDDVDCVTIGSDCAIAAPAIDKASIPAVIILFIVVHLRVSAHTGTLVLIVRPDKSFVGLYFTYSDLYFELNICMSWFKRSPRVKEPPRPIPHRSSPAAERQLKETKKSGPDKTSTQTTEK